jgi:hypothetical protein
MGKAREYEKRDSGRENCCPTCGKPLQLRNCLNCGGKGFTRILLLFKRTCETCQGSGKVYRCPDYMSHLWGRLRAKPSLQDRFRAGQPLRTPPTPPKPVVPPPVRQPGRIPAAPPPSPPATPPVRGIRHTPIVSPASPPITPPVRRPGQIPAAPPASPPATPPVPPPVRPPVSPPVR